MISWGNFKFLSFNTNPRFPPFLLCVRCKSGIYFVRRRFRDANEETSVRAAHLALTLVDVKVRSSMKPLLDGRWIPNSVFGQRVSHWAALISRLILIMQSTAESVNLVTFSFSTFCHLVNWSRH